MVGRLLLPIQTAIGAFVARGRTVSEQLSYGSDEKALPSSAVNWRSDHADLRQMWQEHHRGRVLVFSVPVASLMVLLGRRPLPQVRYAIAASRAVGRSGPDNSDEGIVRAFGLPQERKQDAPMPISPDDFDSDAPPSASPLRPPRAVVQAPSPDHVPPAPSPALAGLQPVTSSPTWRGAIVLVSILLVFLGWLISRNLQSRGATPQATPQASDPTPGSDLLGPQDGAAGRSPVEGPRLVEKARDMYTVTDAGALAESTDVIARFTTVLTNPGASPAAWRRRVTIWNGTTGAIVRSFDLGGGNASSVLALNNAGTRVAAEDGNGRVQIWNVATGNVVASSDSGRAQVSALVFDSSGARLAIGRQSGVVEVWNADLGVGIATSHTHTDPVGVLAFSPDGETLVSGSGGAFDYTARVWDSRTLSPIKVLNNIGGIASAIAFSRDGRQFAIAMWATVSVWRLPDVEHVCTLPFQSQHVPVTALAFAANGATLFTAHPFDGVRRWDIASVKLLNTMNLEDRECYFPLIGLVDSGRVLVTACKDIRRWRVRETTTETEPGG